MNHSKATTTIDAYRRDELSDQLRVELNEHLATCSDCSTYAESSALLTAELRQLGSQVPPQFEAALESVHRSTMAAIRSESEKPESFFGWVLGWARPQVLAPAGAAAALLAVVLVLVATPRRTIGPADGSESAMATVEVSALPASLPQQAVGAPDGDFLVFRQGKSVKIEWPHNGRNHRVRQAADPQSVVVAGGQIVHGKVWSDRTTPASPGSVTYYLID